MFAYEFMFYLMMVRVISMALEVSYSTHNLLIIQLGREKVLKTSSEESPKSVNSMFVLSCYSCSYIIYIYTQCICFTYIKSNHTFIIINITRHSN
jgi:hypothetical protein